MPRPPRIQFPSTIYHIVTQGDGRRKLFHDARHYERFTEGLKQEVERSGWIVLAYCWMPNHIHAPFSDSLGLPISDGAVGIKAALQNFLLKRMFFHFLFIDLDPQTGTRVGPHYAALGLHGEPLLHHVRALRHIGVHRFANDVGGRGKSQLQRSRGTHRTLRIVRLQGLGKQQAHAG